MAKSGKESKRVVVQLGAIGKYGDLAKLFLRSKRRRGYALIQIWAEA